MSTKHQRTLKALFQTPIPKDLNWRDVKSLLEALGVEIAQGAGSRVTLARDGRKGFIHVPHPKHVLLTGHVKDIRRFLVSIGEEPQ